MDHLPKLGRRKRWVRAGRRDVLHSTWRAVLALAVVVFFLGVGVGRAYAYGTVAAGTVSGFRAVFGNNVAYGDGVTETAARSALVAAMPGSYLGACASPGGWNVKAGGSTGWQMFCGTSYGGDVGTAPRQVVGCPANSTGTSACTCSNGYKPNTGATACAPVNCAAAVAYVDLMSSSAMLSSSLSTDQCYDGCSVHGSMASQAADGKYYLYGPYTTDGSYCSGTAGTGKTVEPAGAPSACSKGMCPGTVNGTTACYPCGTTATGTKTSAETVSTSASGASAPAGSTSTTQNTVCTNGSCTTTTTTTVINADGSKSTTTGTGDKPTTDMGGFCKENPGSPICRTSSFGGACAGGFQCDGDAVQCAVAREQHVRNCVLFDQATSLSTAGYAATTAGDRPGDHPGNSAESSAMDFASRIDQTDRLGGGGLTDIVVPVGSLQSVTIPVSQMAAPLALLGNLLVGVTMFWALFIVFGRK